MSYEVRNIRDRVAVGDDCFWLEKLSDGRYRLVPAPDSITEVGTSVDRALLQPMENEIARLAESLPETSTSDSGKALVVGADGRYALGEAGAKDAVLYTPQTLTANQKTQARTNLGLATVASSGSYNDLSNKPTIPTVPSTFAASKVTAGTLAGKVQANTTAMETVGNAQVRDIVASTTDLTAGTSTLTSGQVYLVYE